MPVQQIGGSFAPPLTDELLKNYKALIATVDPKTPVADALRQLLTCCEKWWQLPESTGEGTPHASGRGIAVPLDAKATDTLWDLIPWEHELRTCGELFEPLTGKLRHAAFHLLWHVNELNLDREPITSDKL